MSSSEVQGFLGLQLDFVASHVSATTSVAHNVQENQLSVPGRARSQPLSESSQRSMGGRRVQSEGSASIHLAVPVPRTPPAVDDAVPAEPPSPVPTEIIPPELTQEEIVADIQDSGIKVRDFAYEDAPPVQQRAPELFDPIQAWHVYESMLGNPSTQRNCLNGKHLRRLLDLGWVSEEADGHRWLKKDREALEQFDARPSYPWMAYKLPKPKREDLTQVATARFQWVNADQLVPQFVNRGISRASATRGARYVATPYRKRPLAQEDAEKEEDSQISPALKKRRLSADGESEASGSRRPPSPPAQFSLRLINGRLPQQYPAGRPSRSTPRPAPLPAQGAFTRSLQRHLSMTSLSSPYPTNLSSSDSRTNLTHE